MVLLRVFHHRQGQIDRLYGSWLYRLDAVDNKLLFFDINWETRNEKVEYYLIYLNIEGKISLCANKVIATLNSLFRLPPFRPKYIDCSHPQV